MKLLGLLPLLVLSLTFISCEESHEGVVLDTPVWEKSVKEIEINSTTILETANAELNKIAALNENELTFENTVVALDDTYYKVTTVWNRMEIIANTNLDKEMREKADEMNIKFQKWFVDAESRKDIYKVVQKFADSKPQIQGEDLRLLEYVLRDYKRVGFHLPEATQTEIKKLKKELATLQTKISQNTKDENNNLVLLSEKDVEGIPQKILSDLKKDENGNYMIHAGVSFETTAIVDNSPIEEVRKRVFTAKVSRAKDSNRQLTTEVIKKKAKLAKLLGYKSWADYQIEVKMAQDGATAMKFVSELKEGLEPKFKKELAILTKLKTNETGDPEAKINAWDAGYYMRLLAKEQFQLDMDDLKKYFKYENVLNGMFRIYEELFSIKIEEAKGEYYAWAPKVKLMKITDARNGKPLGLLYLDMFPRPADGKYGHFAMFTIRSGKQISKDVYRRPVASLVCNFPEPTADKPSLLSFREVETLFHEFGHGLHSLLTEAKYSSFSGTNVPRDFVEVPSQLLESWVSNIDILHTFAINYQDNNDKFPAETLEKIKKANLATIGMFYRRQLSFGTMDLRLHSQIDENSEFDIIKYTNDVLSEVYLPYPEDSSFITSFGHLFGGYDAGYYGYAWADNIAADMASIFENAPQGFMDKEIGMRLREEIYQTGNSREIKDIAKAFLQREPNNKAFLKKLGIE